LSTRREFAKGGIVNGLFLAMTPLDSSPVTFARLAQKKL
jgi:hypothetical protein